MEEPTIDAADLAAAVFDDPSLAETSPTETIAPTVWSEAQRAIVTLMAIAIALLIVAVAVMAGDGTARTPCFDEPRNGGLFDDAERRFANDDVARCLEG